MIDNNSKTFKKSLLNLIIEKSSHGVVEQAEALLDAAIIACYASGVPAGDVVRLVSEGYEDLQDSEKESRQQFQELFTND